MKYIDFIKQLDHRPDHERLEIIIAWLQQHGIPFRRQDYRTGSNLVIDLGAWPRRTGISSHFDKIEESGGANDNGSAIAVCLGIIERFMEKKDETMGLRIFFFDEEENGLRGSAAYTRQYGIADLTGLINMELVGMGNKLALWPVNQKDKGTLLQAVEQSATRQHTQAIRFDKIITNTADHLSFRNAGLADAFTITCISDDDIKAAHLYYKALQQGADTMTLHGILHRAPVFAHYHQPSDTFEKLEERTLAMVAEVIWNALPGHQHQLI
ncbi:MAG TPA: M28 family peptidase [Chitinophagaceae bacterium]|jgi:hypothetical protein